MSSTADTNEPGGRLDSVELFNFLLQHIPDLIFFKDRDSRFICVNRAFLRRFGVTRQEKVVGKSDFDFLLPEDAQRTWEDEQKVIQSGEPSVGHVTRKIRRDGSVWWSLTTKMPLRNAKDEIVGTCGISKDITSLKEAEDALEYSNQELERTLSELKAAQRQLIAAEKAHSVAKLAAGLAHEVRNPLNILTTGLEFIASELSTFNNSTISIVLDEMQTAIRRTDKVISALMEASSQEAITMEKVDLNALIKAAVSEATDRFKLLGIQVQMKLAPGPLFAKVDLQKMHQVIDGIINNAIEAMPGGGDLEISTRIEELTSEAITRDAGARGAQRFYAGDQVVLILIADTGTGIPQEVISKIYDPFFTMKEPGGKTGLGLGLTVCRALVEQHGGEIMVRNRSDRNGVEAILKIEFCE